MNKFTKRINSSMLLAITGLIVLTNIEDWARISGEINRTFLLLGTLITFALSFLSTFFLFKANLKREKSQIIMSLFISLLPLGIFIMNSLVFAVWFIGK